MSFISQAAICFIACHGGPADHFATFAQKFPKNTIDIYASGPALAKFKAQQIEPKQIFTINDITDNEAEALAEELAKTCAVYSIVITDVGDRFDIKLQHALARWAPNTRRIAYYDNPEPYVPGGYSEVASKVMLAAQSILFANSNLAQSTILQATDLPIDFGSLEKVGIGYYPIQKAIDIAEQRKALQAIERKNLFEKHHILDKSQQILVYLGGNNKEYFDKAFPAFISLLTKGVQQSDLSHLVFVIQQHPGAKEKNFDKELLSDWKMEYGTLATAPKIIISDFTSDTAQIIADTALYYQTSMGPQLVLAGIPTVQIAHNRFEDVLVSNNLSPSVTSIEQFLEVISNLAKPKKEIDPKALLASLGIKENWLEILETSLRTHS